MDRFGPIQLRRSGGTGAEVEGHDWEAILSAVGWLGYDRVLGLTAHGLGVVTMIGALVWGGAVLATERRHVARVG